MYLQALRLLSTAGPESSVDLLQDMWPREMFLVRAFRKKM